jgi:hypothetical protein
MNRKRANGLLDQLDDLGRAVDLAQKASRSGSAQLVGTAATAVRDAAHTSAEPSDESALASATTAIRAARDLILEVQQTVAKRPPLRRREPPVPPADRVEAARRVLDERKRAARRP